MPDITQPNQAELGTTYDEKLADIDEQVEARKARIDEDTDILGQLRIARNKYASRLAALDGTTPDNQPDSVTIEGPDGQPVSIPTIPAIEPKPEEPV